MANVPTRRSWFYQFIRALALLEVALIVACLGDLLLHPIAPDITSGSQVMRLLGGVVATPAILLLAVLVLRRTRGNLVGWLLVLWAAMNISGTLRVDAFGGYAAELATIAQCVWPSLWTLPVHFPDGEPYPRRLGWVAQGLAAGLIIMNVLSFLGSPQIGASWVFRAGSANQFYLPALYPINELSESIATLPVLALILLPVISVVLRFRASRGRARQQIKFMLWVVVLLVALGVAGGSPGTRILYDNPATLTGWRLWLYPVFSTTMTVLPVAGIALPILRHRLYDIDIIIRRTVTYALLTALLLATYFGSVIVMQQLFVALTGQRSEAAIVVSTLVIAVLVVPLRNRIQSVIDQRFFRRKYDAQHVMESFSHTVRDETDPDKLTGRLIEAIDDTLQPERVSLWVNLQGPVGLAHQEEVLG